MSARRRSLTVGLLALALSAGLVSAEAAPPSPAAAPEASQAPPFLPPAAPVGPVAPASAAAAEPTTKNAVYAYDAASRLVGVTDPAGQTARYRYDAAGNRLGVDRFASSTLSVLSLVPVRAQAGAKVTLSGTGFSTTPASNAVKFGTTAATVDSATATRLVVTVPAAAASGKVSVTTGGTTVQSAESFTLATPAPSLMAVAPASGTVDTEVTLTGAGFAPALTDNVVRFGGGIVAQVTARTATALTVRVPLGAVTGPVEVETPDGRVTSADSFRVLSGTGVGEIESSVVTSLTDESPPTVSVATPGNRAQVRFDADAGADIGIGFTASTFNATVTARLYDPEGEQVGGNESLTGVADDWEVEDLPQAGTYSVILTPAATAVGQATITVSAPKTGVLGLTGPTAEVSLARAGQDGVLTFDAVLGDSLSLGIDSADMPKGMYARLYGPDGDQVINRFVGGGGAGAIDIDTLTQSGTYTLTLDPDTATSGTVRVTGSHYADAGVLDSAGPTVELPLNRPGQDGRATFTAQAGERVSLGVTATGFTGHVRMEFRRPNGTQFAFFLAPGTTSTEYDTAVLPDSGTYTLAALPSNAATTGNLSLTLSRPLGVAQLSTTGGPVDVDITRFAQDAESAFQATAGDSLTLGVTDNAFTDTVRVSVIAPSGTAIVDEKIVSTGKPATFPLAALAESGTYRVVVDPNRGARGTLKLTLSAGAQAQRVVDVAEDKPAAPKKPTAGVVPAGPDAWQPGKSSLAGRDWVTARGKAPKAPPALRGPPGKTTLTGHILKLDGKPLAKVTVSVGKKSAKTDTRGRFLLSGIADTSTTLVVEGASANNSKRSYGRYDIRISLKAGRTVDLGFPVWMTPLDTKNTVRFAAPAKADVVLKTPKIPGLEVRIPKGSVVRDEKGKPVTELGITAIPIDRPPFPLPENGIVPVYFTVQPGGTYVFPEGAQIIYPNYTREAPGTRVKFLDYDPKKKGWHVYGTGEVSADGSQVVPDKKTRVWAFHGAMFNTDDLIPWDTSWLQDVMDWLSGDPVELSTGLLTDSRTDLAVADSRGGAELTRTYWQGDPHPRAFGIGRDLSYNVFLNSKRPWQEVDLYLPGGSKVHFTRTSPGTGWNDAVFEALDTSSDFQGVKITKETGRWDLTFRDGTVWEFPQYGPLKAIHDRHGNTVKLTRRAGSDADKGEITRITSPGGRWITLSYDTQHRVTSATDNTGRTTSYTYDAGRLETVKDPAGKISRYTYDGTSNRIKTATDARGITYMQNEFDADGRVKKQTLTEGAEYSFAYTQTGAGKITSANVTQPGGSVRRVEFDADGYGIKDTEAYGSTLARETQYHRGPKHRIDAVTDPYNRRTELTYDANGYVTRTTELAGTAQARQSGTAVYNGPYDQPTSVSDPLGNTTTLGYDESGDLRTVTDPEGRETTLTYTSDGQIKTVTDASDAVTEYTYRHGELVSVKDAEGRTGAQFLDAAGRPTVITDEAGSVTTLTYDALNQTRKITDPLGQSTSLDFDENGNIKTLTDARQNSTSWVYDDADRTESVTDPLGAQALFGYDAAGRLTKATSRSGLVATAEYDLLGRAKNAKYGVNAAGVAESTATYAYDAVDLPKTVTDTQAGTESFAYDAYDRLKTLNGPTGTVGYDYDGADRRKEMTAAGTTTTYGYDTSSILTSVTSGSQEVSFGLDAVGREKTANLPGGIARTTTLDKTGVVSGIDYTRGAAAVGDLTYTRDTQGLQTGLTGSLASVALPAAENGAVFGKDNRVTSLGGRSFTYDADGQLKSDGKRTYDWNARGQLSGVQSATGGPASQFSYDPLGIRSGKTLGDATQKYLTDGSNPLVEQDGSGAAKATVATSGLDEYLTRTENGATQVYLTDALGSVVGLANADGTVATSYTYDPYGQPTTSGTASTNPYTFTGRESDGTGLLYYRNRYYDPESGRFISQDPIGHAGGTNLYQYALSSPTTYTDPTGNSPMLAGCVIGGLGEAGLDWLGQRLSGRKVNWGQVGTSAALGCAGGMIGKWASLGKIDNAKSAIPGPGCRVKIPNSFTADTPVLLADGTRKPIKDIQIGDEVLATDPETGESGPRPVTALIKGAGDKQLVDITLDTGKTSTVTATDGHPFWVPALGRWIEAGELTTGQWLQTSSGTWVQISAVTHHTKRTTVYNLTVNDLHTYYVLAGDTPVLAHNIGGKKGGYGDACKLFYPGKHAGGSIDARNQSRAFNSAEIVDINKIGNKFGCHTCGTMSSGYPNGTWVKDHQPVSTFVDKSVPQQLFPHCRRCSSLQGIAAAQFKRDKINPYTDF
ncbi:RHS repeat-associated core domain-containing protein [Streptomyces sp. NBC_01716]|uniref:RHS repeat-associated core domain-containing protein n=1 Tax=Streptomyces sp. NBC_01716 TaxID=2975917 RepID=UPI002E3058E0|nr:RHS repeat-associated core domain-containing protein [Streptomyces sp. NBC_01716]